ncbi:uncharacterized protein LOC113797064 [Dermatophagoides pteronyssinus]|uniref:uncharacterized protein LOC113797064 n=1 Tax=Dermatophagoides pteronyssinus TaxID=6956 RepID=UPI003F66FE3A
METKTEINIFAVRLFYNFYSMTGFCFGRFEWKQRWSMIKLTIMLTLFINAIFYMYIQSKNHHQYNNYILATKISQNVFGHFIDMGNSFIFFLVFFVAYFVYSFNGLDLISLANSSIFQQIYCDNSRNRIISSAIFIMAIVNTLLLYISCFDEVSINLEAINGSYIVYNLFIGYLFFLIHMAEIGVRLVFYYFKNAIRRLLQRIELQFISNEINDEQCLHTIRKLTNISMKFHQKAGLLGLIYIFEWSYYWIQTLLQIHIGLLNYFQLIMIFINTLCIFHWIWMDYQIQKSFKNIIKQLCWRNNQQQQNFKIKTTKSMKHLLQILDNERQTTMDIDQLWPLFDQIGAIWLIKIRPQLRNQIRYFEMSELYQEYFRMNFYDFFIYDQRFLLSMIIFSTSYFVLIIQTEK